jgi:hypothetical protein
MMLVVWRPPLDIAMLAAYRKVRAAADKQREYYNRTVKQIDHIVNKLADEHCVAECERIDELQRELRLITKGVPLTEALTTDDKNPLLSTTPGFSQRQYDAHTQVLKNAYRKLAMLCHPDREGGDRQLWGEVEAAYGMRDIKRLNAIYLSIVQGRNLYWQQGEGVYHVSSELERYRVELEMMKQTAGWRASRWFLAGAVNTAVEVVRAFMLERIAALLNEINYINTKGKYHGEEGKEGREVEGQGIDGQEIERVVERLQKEVESAGESAPGQG